MIRINDDKDDENSQAGNVATRLMKGATGRIVVCLLHGVNRGEIFFLSRDCEDK